MTKIVQMSLWRSPTYFYYHNISICLFVCFFFGNQYESSNINEVISPVLKFFFYDKISQVQKSTKKHQKELKSTKKHQKAPKSIKKHINGKK